MQRLIVIVTIILCAGPAKAQRVFQTKETTGDESIRRYNVVWDSPSRDASGRMPLGNGDIGANASLFAGDLSFGDPARLSPPARASGYPSRAQDLDVLPGFQDPPAGYGEVPFWWWTGDPLDKDRLLWQIEQLHAKGIPGMQVNYAHEDTPGWPTYANEPEICSDAWWDIWKFVAAECSKRDMGIGLSGYTIDWPNGRSLVSRTIYSDPEIQGREIKVAHRARVKSGLPPPRQNDRARWNGFDRFDQERSSGVDRPFGRLGDMDVHRRS